MLWHARYPKPGLKDVTLTIKTGSGGTWEGAILEALRKNGNSGHLSYLLVKSDYVFVFILKIKACLNLLVA